ncbi:uncharacterized protein FA14DRAFT_161588 [Meira miltonrushii]|uniref:Luciferase domain-containing protein n=1 Tax=Meira miltonrushii TaxID=1280837 RepID=A0A316V982_9BASI|nr:uncharacterized protein FA14DRAFT_161588 [Meira miltonrushii]PWN34012.1 hypothetical protein FA14DRAFT_161588 [Meira miltonrushii]
MSLTVGNARIGISRIPEYATLLYRKAPTSVVTIGSIVISYLFRLAYNDYQLFKALGKGGLGKPSILTWLIHTIALRPLALPKRAAFDVNTFPLDDPEWKGMLAGLPKRKGERPFVFGMIPHRQLEAIAPQGGDIQKAIIDHLSQIAKQNPDSITLALSTYEATDSPCLFVKHGNGSPAKPSTMAKFYLAGTPAPHLALEGDERNRVLPRDPTKHELAHIHLSEGSMHLTLSPQDARKVVKEGYGERHRLAGMAYRGNYIPPYWLPNWMYNLVGGEANVRWSYQQVMLNKIKSNKIQQAGKLVPPTYTCIYAPTNEEELQWTLNIIDSSVAWSLGRDVM